MERVLAAWDSHLTHASLPRTLTSQLREAGFEEVRMEGHTFATDELSPETYGGFLVDFAEQFVVDQRPGRRRRREGVGGRAARAGRARRLLLRVHPVLLRRAAPPLDSKRCISDDPPALEVRGLTKRYDDGTLAVEDFDLEIPAGAFFGLLGPNGAGKTTLISAVCNLIRVTEGEVLVFGEPADTLLARSLDRAGRAGHQPRPLPDRARDAHLPRRLLRDGARRGRGARRGDDRRLRPPGQARHARPEALGRPAPPPAAGPRADAPAAPRDPRRAHRRRGLRAAHRAVALHPPAARRGHHDPPHHALPRGGREAVRGDRADPRRAPDRARHRRRPQRALRRRPAPGRLREGDGRATVQP